jgi:hypothetical protein
MYLFDEEYKQAHPMIETYFQSFMSQVDTKHTRV